jgi:DNA polymerase zeta
VSAETETDLRVKVEKAAEDEVDIIDDLSDFSDDDEEENPFELFASTQLPREAVKADINQHMISRTALDDVDEDDEEEMAMQQHERDARQRAEDGKRFRATQASQRKQESDDEYGDDELDELFRRTVMGGWSNQTTPRKDRSSMTPTTGSRSGMSSGGIDNRRRSREMRLIEQAGFGDLRYVPSMIIMLMLA